MIKKLARWILREELKAMEQSLIKAQFMWALWKGRHEQLAKATWGEGFSPFKGEE